MKGVFMLVKRLWFGTSLCSNRCMKRLDRLLKFQKNEAAQFRMQVLNYQKKYGTKLTMEAYGMPKSTIYRWKKRLEESGGRLTSLIPQSTAPKRRRRMIVDYRIVSFIESEREKHLIGKEKLKPLLDEYCQEHHLKPPSESLIGKIIKRYNIYPQGKNGRIYHNPGSKWATKKMRYKEKVKRAPQPKEFGYLEIDTLSEFQQGIKRYIFSAIDAKLRFKFSYPYKSLNSHNGKDFLIKLFSVYPIKNGIHTIQTDNGSEFLGQFHQYLKQKGIKHLFSYPRCPKINGHIERAQRTLKEEFLNQHRDLLFTDMPAFAKELMKYLVWYNTKRVHKALGNLSPIDYLLKTLPESQMYVTYTTS